ncbi:hypothetical protein V6N13_046258 [Hibiscus sabdariffa]
MLPKEITPEQRHERVETDNVDINATTSHQGPILQELQNALASEYAQDQDRAIRKVLCKKFPRVVAMFPEFLTYILEDLAQPLVHDAEISSTSNDKDDNKEDNVQDDILQDVDIEKVNEDDHEEEQSFDEENLNQDREDAKKLLYLNDDKDVRDAAAEEDHDLDVEHIISNVVEDLLKEAVESLPKKSTATPVGGDDENWK